MTLSKMKLGVNGTQPNDTINYIKRYNIHINDTRHLVRNAECQIFYCYDECHYAHYHSAGCHYAECKYADFYVEFYRVELHNAK